MPYIKMDDRTDLDKYINQLNMVLDQLDYDEIAGAMNYVITRIVTHGASPRADWKYHQLNTAVGVLECAKQELYRRVGGPKEVSAINVNGDTKEYAAWMENRYPGDFR